MRIDAPPRRPPAENILPMINVVFLLLIFFLISARLTPPEPFPVTLPDSASGTEGDGDGVLYLAADGRIGYRDSEGDAALAALAADLDAFCPVLDCAPPGERPALTLRADAGVPAADLARLMPKLAALGFGRVDLLVQPR